MPYQLEFHALPTYLRVRVTGENNRETVTKYLAEIASECQRRDVFRVLIDDQLSGPRLPMMDVFAIASEGSMQSIGMFDAIAYVDKDMGDLGNFAETVAVNRGMPVAIFADVTSAEKWLADRTPESRDENIFTDESR